jgi:hypothetical protein
LPTDFRFSTAATQHRGGGAVTRRDLPPLASDLLAVHAGNRSTRIADESGPWQQYRKGYLGS